MLKNSRVYCTRERDSKAAWRNTPKILRAALSQESRVDKEESGLTLKRHDYRYALLPVSS